MRYGLWGMGYGIGSRMHYTGLGNKKDWKRRDWRLEIERYRDWRLENKKR